MDSGAHITCRATCRAAGRTLQASSTRLRDATFGDATASQVGASCIETLPGVARREGEEVGAWRFLLVGLAVMLPALIAAIGTRLVLVPR